MKIMVFFGDIPVKWYFQIENNPGSEAPANLSDPIQEIGTGATGDSRSRLICIFPPAR
jgi:hypothetical protein